MFRQRALFCVAVVIAGCGSIADFDPKAVEYTGEEARKFISGTLPPSATDFYVYDGGTFNGTIYYSAVSCATVDDCWTVVAALGGPKKEEFHPSIQTAFAVNIDGPGFYWPEMETPLWQFNSDAEGFSWERSRGDEWMEFWAIDTDAKRVFYHKESGGFPTDPPEEGFRSESDPD